MDCLLFSYYFWNEGYPSAHHLMDRLPLVAASGVRFRVISSMAAVRQGSFQQLRVPPVLPGDLRFVLRMRAKRSPRKKLAGLAWKLAFLPLLPLFFLERLIPIRDFTWSWCIPASVCGIAWSLRRRPEVLYSFGGRNSAHLAAAIVSRVLRIPWVAQVQDPLLHGYAARGPVEMRFVKWIEKTIMKGAHRVVFMTDTARKVAEERTGCRGVGVVNYPGFEPRWFEGASYSRGEAMNILHVGSFAGSRNPETFLLALAMAVKEDPSIREKVRFEMLGNFGIETKPALERFPWPDMIKVSSFAPRKEAYRRMAAADVLLLIQNAEGISSETIPSKFYEYLLARRPILGLLYRNPELAEMMRRFGHRAVELDDIDGIARQLEALQDQWRRDDFPAADTAQAPTTDGCVAVLAALLKSAALGAK